MDMTHLGYIVYITLVLALYGSPVILFLLWRGWKTGRFLRSFLFVLFSVPALAVLLYGLFWGGLLLLAAITR